MGGARDTDLFTTPPKTFDDFAIQFQWEWRFRPSIRPSREGPWSIRPHDGCLWRFQIRYVADCNEILSVKGDCKIDHDRESDVLVIVLGSLADMTLTHCTVIDLGSALADISMDELKAIHIEILSCLYTSYTVSEV